MKKIYGTILILLACGCAGGQLRTLSPAQDQAVAVVRAYIQAGDTQNADLFRQTTHQSFTVVAADYPKPGKASIISRQVFAGLLAGKKIGGQPRSVAIERVTSLGGSSVQVELSMRSRSLAFRNRFTLVRSAGKSWKIVQDLAHAVPVGK